MESVKYYHVSDSGLVEGVALGRTTVVLVSDFSRVSAENLSLQQELDRQKRYVEINANSAHGKHMEGLRYRDERDALQLLLNDRDGLEDQITSLEQRRHAEQQACQAAERRVEELEGWCRKIMNSSETMLSTVHEEELFALIEPADAGGYGNDEDAALNPTTEAVSHE